MVSELLSVYETKDTLDYFLSMMSFKIRYLKVVLRPLLNDGVGALTRVQNQL